MLLIETSETESIVGKPLIRTSLPLLLISTKNITNTLSIINITLQDINTPITITVKPQAATISISDTKSTRITISEHRHRSNDNRLDSLDILHNKLHAIHVLSFP